MEELTDMYGDDLEWSVEGPYLDMWRQSRRTCRVPIRFVQRGSMGPYGGSDMERDWKDQ